MLEISVPEMGEFPYDSCGNTTVAVLTVGTIKIPLCQECYDELFYSISNYENTCHCYQCQMFIPNNDGFRYDGSCKFKANGDVHPDHVGYLFPTASLDSCSNGVKDSSYIRDSKEEDKDRKLIIERIKEKMKSIHDESQKLLFEALEEILDEK